MSLLLQALQQASKTREGAEADSSSGADDDLALEPLAEPKLAESDDEPASRSTASQAHAATVLRASELPSFNALDWAREHYMLSFLGAAILVAVFYGTYVYIQVSNPGLLRGTPRPAQSPIQAAVPPPPPAPAEAPAATKISGMPAIETTPGAATGQLPPAKPVQTARQPKPRPVAVARESSAARPIVQLQNGPQDGDNSDLETVVIPDSVPMSVAAPQGRDEIAVRRKPSTEAVDANILGAYEALRAGKYAEAKQLYGAALSADPRSIDALLGLAAISWKEGRSDDAASYYGRILEAEPRNPYAQAGLIAIVGGADPVAAESRLKLLVSREPSGFLYFTLGNLYADQAQWPAAQQAYFQAQQYMPDNPDYAFNLAVALEHVGQSKLALQYYRKALDLSFKQGRANFNQNLAIERVGQLSARQN
jgi:Tfp pilus assembly protein PilF